MAAMAQFERDLTSQRTREGLRAKMEAGVRVGRPCYKFDYNLQFDEFYDDWESGMQYPELMKKYNISRPTVATIVKKCKQRKYSYLRDIDNIEEEKELR